MDFIQEQIEKEREASPEFRDAYDREVRVDSAERALVEKLIEMRQAAGLTQADVAKRMGVSQPRIAQLERMGDGYNLRTLIEVADIVGASVTLTSAGQAQVLRKVSEAGRGKYSTKPKGKP